MRTCRRTSLTALTDLVEIVVVASHVCRCLLAKTYALKIYGVKR